MRYRLIALVLLSLLGSISAQAEPLKVKPGLWETTTMIEKKGAKHPTNLDKLTPEQRAKVEKELAARVKRETRTVKSCLREAQIKSGEAFTGNPHRGACSHKFQTQTASDVVASVECRGANKMVGTVKMHAADPEHMAGRIDMTYGASDKLQLLTHSEISARWLQADCGKAVVKAHAQPN
jgi:hypothetical protein